MSGESRASRALGHRLWCFSGGNIPEESTGREPEFTSRDELCLLNTSESTAVVKADVYFADQPPVGPFEIEVAGGRVCHVRINDLIDPQAVPLGVAYGLVVRSTGPIVAQLTRTDTRRGGLTVSQMSGVPLDDDATELTSTGEAH